MNTPHLLLLGCPHCGLDDLARAAARAEGWTYAGDLQPFTAPTLRELLLVWRRAQEPMPVDLVATLARAYPASGDPRADAEAALELRGEWTGAQLLRDLAEKFAPARLVFCETTAALRLPQLERWLDCGLPLHCTQVVPTPAAFAAAATEMYRGRLFVPPDYRSHDGRWPRFEPQLVWYRLQLNYEALRAQLPAASWTRLAQTDAAALARQPAATFMAALLEAGMPAVTRAEPPPELAPEVLDLARRYGLVREAERV